MNYLKKTGGFLLNIFFGLLLVVGAALIVMRICGFKILAVETGSMGESCPVGSLIIADNCSPEGVRTGDVISFVANERLVTVTHRVVAVDEENQLFYTRGDANNTADSSPVLFENLIGKVRIKIPLLGYVFIWAHTKGGKIVIALGLTLMAVCITGCRTLRKFLRKEA